MAEPGHHRTADDDIVPRLRRWCVEEVLPLWSGIGFDRERGGFHESLQLDGTPNRQANKRLLVQARQIYVYAHAAHIGWASDGCARALDALDFVLRHYRADGRPGFAHVVAPSGEIVNPLRDTYGHAFMVLSLSWLARVSGDAQVRAVLDDVLAFIEEHLTAADGSLREGIPPSLPRRQNPHMHMFEAMLAAHENLAAAGTMARAERYKRMLEDVFLDPETATIREFFGDDWQPSDGAAGDSVEPGHLAEWAWLLRRYDRICNAEPSALPTRLLASAVRWRETATGLLIDEVDRRGEIRKASRRTWPQTELARAWIAEAEIGRTDAGAEARAVLRAVSEHYLDRPFRGGWTDQFDAGGRPITQWVPASTLYHLFGVIAEADRVLGPAPSGASALPPR